jgi:hypothetical protein
VQGMEGSLRVVRAHLNADVAAEVGGSSASP